MIRRIVTMSYLVVISSLIIISTIQVVSAKENITGLSISPAGPLQANTPVTVTANASAAPGETLYYKFYYCANYGTAEYASSPWVVVQEYSTANAAQYTFPTEGKYIVIVRVVTDPNNEPVALPIIGQEVTIGVRNNPSFNYFSTDFASNPNAYDSVTITVNADTDTTQNIYYKFYYCANYGTDKYASSPWIVVQDYSTANSAVYSFPAEGDYIVIARAVTDPNDEPADLPITGGTISVNRDAGYSLSTPTDFWASQGTYTDKISLGWGAVAGATGYNVYTSSSPAGAYRLLGYTTDLGGTHTSVTAGTINYYRITATSGVVESPLSIVFSGYTSSGVSLVAPTGLSASQGTYPDKISLSWNTVPGAIGYNVYYSDGYFGTYSLLGSVATAGADVTSLSPGTTRYFKVSATAGSVESPLSVVTSGYTSAAISYYSTTVSRNDTDLYEGNYDDLFILTNYCSEFVNFDHVKIYSNNTIMFSSGRTCGINSITKKNNLSPGNYSVQVTRKSTDWYAVSTYNSFIKTRFCYQYKYYNNATLNIRSYLGTGVLTFSDGTYCNVDGYYAPVNLF